MNVNPPHARPMPLICIHSTGSQESIAKSRGIWRNMLYVPTRVDTLYSRPKHPSEVCTCVLNPAQRTIRSDDKRFHVLQVKKAAKLEDLTAIACLTCVSLPCCLSGPRRAPEMTKSAAVLCQPVEFRNIALRAHHKASRPFGIA